MFLVVAVAAAALEHADGAVVPPAVAEGESDPYAKVLDHPVQFLAGRGVGADGLDPIHERHGLIDLRLDARWRFPMRHPLLGVGPPTDWGELVQIHDDRDVFQASPDELPAIDIHSL